MLPLADVQRRIRDAVVRGDAAAAAPLLLGGADASRRLDIHRRHYQASLLTAVMGRFPATGWLVGTPMLEEAAARFVRECPPTAPCIAEYGRAFPLFLASQPGAERVAYLRAFADLDWHLGRLAVAIDLPSIGRAAFADISPGALADTVIAIQPGTYYTHSDSPIDELIGLYLTDAMPAQMTLREAPVWVEVIGARGALRFNRLTRSDFRFREAVWNGDCLGAAAELAGRVDPTFDPGKALAALIDAGLATGIHVTSPGGPVP